MPKLPRAEQKTIYSPARMPNLVGDGYTAAARGEAAIGQAVQQLGRGIGALGAGLEAAGQVEDKEDEYRAKMELVNFTNRVQADDMTARQSFTGDMDPNGWAEKRMEFYRGESSRVMEGIRSPKARQMAAHYFAQHGGSYQRGAIQFEGQARISRLVSDTQASITGGFDMVDLRNFKSLPQEEQATRVAALEQQIKGAAAMARDMPGVSEAQRAAIWRHTSDLSIKKLEALPPDLRATIAERLQREWTAAEQAQTPQSPGQSGRLEIAPAPLRRTVGAPRQGRVQGIVLHQTWGSDTMEGNGSWSNKTGTGAHYYIAKDGKVYQWAPDEIRMAHAGKGRGGAGDRRPDLGNDNTIGIEIMTRPNERPNAKQIEVARALGQQLMQKYGIKPTDVVGHGEIAGGHRRSDEAIEAVKAIRGEDGGQPQQVAAAPKTMAARGLVQHVGLKSSGAASSEPLVAGPDGKIDPVAFASRTAFKIAQSPLNGKVPAWGPSFGITTGSPQEWARFFTMLQQQESGHRVVPVNPDGSLRRFSTTAAGEQSFGPGQFKPGEYGLKTWADVNNPDKVIDAYIEVAKQDNLMAYFGSLKRSDEWRQHTDWYEKSVAGKLPKDGAPLVAGDVTRRAPPMRAGPMSEIIEGIQKRMPQWKNEQLRAVDAMVKQAEASALEGYDLPESVHASIQQSVEATGDPGLMQRMKIATLKAAAVRGRGQMPPDPLADLARNARLGLGTKATPEQLAAVEAIEALAKKVSSSVEKDPIVHHGKAFKVDIPDIDPARMSEAQLRDRLVLAQTIAQRNNRPLRVLKEAEQKAFTDYAMRGGKEALGMLRTIYDVAGPNTATITKEFSKHSTEVAALGWLISSKVDSKTINDLGEAMQLRRSEKFKSIAPAHEQTRSWVQAELGTAFMENPTAAELAIRMANNLYEVRARREGLAGGADTNAAKWKEGLREVIGENKSTDGQITYGGIAKGWFGSNPVWVPPTMRPDKLPDVMKSLTVEDLLAPGAVPEGTQLMTTEDVQSASGGASRNQPQAVPLEGEVPKVGEDWKQSPLAGSPKESKQDKTDRLNAAAPGDETEFDLIRRQFNYGLPVDKHGRQVPMAVVRTSRLVAIGDGKYWLAPKSGEYLKRIAINPRTGEMTTVNVVLDLNSQRLRDKDSLKKPEDRAYRPD